MLITLADAKSYLGITATTDDAVITGFISAAQKAMESFVHRALEAVSVTEILDGSGDYDLFIREPARTITSIHEDDDHTWGAGCLVAAADYNLILLRDGAGRRIHRYDEIWATGVQSAKVVYMAGFASLPEDVKVACQVQIGVLYSEWARAKSRKDVLSSMGVSGWTMTWIAREGLDSGVKSLLEPYENEGF